MLFLPCIALCFSLFGECFTVLILLVNAYLVYACNRSTSISFVLFLSGTILSTLLLCVHHAVMHRKLSNYRWRMPISVYCDSCSLYFLGMVKPLSHLYSRHLASFYFAFLCFMLFYLYLLRLSIWKTISCDGPLIIKLSTALACLECTDCY